MQWLQKKADVLCYLRLDFPADKMKAPEQPQSELWTELDEGAGNKATAL